MKKFRKWVMICVICAAVILGGVYLFCKYQTYSSAYIKETYKNQNVENSNYIEFVDNIFKYSKDGAVLLNKKGEEIWNQPYQMQNPMVEICKGTMVIGDEGGTSILVLQKDGLKGEIQTNRPIEKITVSEQGVVGAVLKDEGTPRIICYDAMGKVLVEQKTSLANTGYPIDISISNDGNMLLVSYLYVKGTTMTTQVVYYNFGEVGKKEKNHQVAQAEHENTIMPTVFFANNKKSFIVGDQALFFYEGKNVPKLTKTIKLEKEIKGVAYNENGIALILKNSGQADSELCLYDLNGKKTMSVNFEGEYSNIRLTEKDVILFDGNKCSIFNKAGVRKFEGKLEADIMEMMPMRGFNKYLVISANELQEVQLAK